MTRKEKIHPIYITFLALMGLLIAIGVFLIVWGSLHNAVPVPTLKGPGLFARVACHA